MATIFCSKLQEEAQSLEAPPFAGPLGEKIFQHISKPAWEMWLKHQTMLINEYRLSLIEPKARAFLLAEMEKFLFQGGAEKPQGYTPT
jgi:Fe-S cluster biosynthesis and repair protein YggX